MPLQMISGSIFNVDETHSEVYISAFPDNPDIHMNSSLFSTWLEATFKRLRSVTIANVEEKLKTTFLNVMYSLSIVGLTYSLQTQ